MNREEAIKCSERAIQELAQALCQGKSEALLSYLDSMSRFHQYSFANCMLIYLQRPDATRVAGFHRWKEFHRWVKKGETGIAILAPMIGKRKSKPAGIQPDQQEAESNDKVVFGFRTVYVFDVTQTEGKPLPEFAKLGGDPGPLQDRLEALVVDCGIQLELIACLGGANGASLDGKIQILSSLDPAQRFSTTVHELAHELLHRGDRRESTTKTIRETEAEAVAYAVCRWAGIDCSTRAADYIQLYCGDDKILMQSLELIRNVAAKIIEAIDDASVDRSSVQEELSHAG